MDIAQTLGMKQHRHRQRPDEHRNYKSDWDAAADVWNELGRQARKRGLRLYTHNHDAAYSFLLDAGPLDANGKPTRSSGMRRLEYFFGKADPKYVFFELDIFWAYVARFKHQTYTDKRGDERTDLFDPILTVAPRADPVPAVPRQGRQQEQRAVPNGYDMVPLGEGDINFQQFFQTIGEPTSTTPTGSRTPRPAARPTPASRWTSPTLSYTNMSELTIYKRGH